MPVGRRPTGASECVPPREAKSEAKHVNLPQAERERALTGSRPLDKPNLSMAVAAVVPGVPNATRPVTARHRSELAPAGLEYKRKFDQPGDSQVVMTSDRGKSKGQDVEVNRLRAEQGLRAQQEPELAALRNEAKKHKVCWGSILSCLTVAAFKSGVR